MNKLSDATRTGTLAVLTAAALALAGCENMSERERGTAKGAGIGAAAGAVLGGVTDGRSGAGTGAVLGGAIGAIAGNVWSKRQEDRRRAMEEATKGTGVEVSRTPDNQLKLNVPSDISFDVGSAAIRPELRSVLDQFASSLHNDPSTLLRIIGHTDNTGSDAINDPLSVQRADSVRDYLGDRGVAASRVQTAGRGAREPVANNDSAAGRAQNRRVEILLREPQAQGQGQPQG
jgi:outer membrane protein OmpA-like peptidoglycan-associated protein